MNRLAAKLKSGSVSWPVREALAFDALDRKRRTFAIVNAESRAGVVTEIEFREIAMQMLLAAMLVSAAHTALEY